MKKSKLNNAQNTAEARLLFSALNQKSMVGKGFPLINNLKPNNCPKCNCKEFDEHEKFCELRPKYCHGDSRHYCDNQCPSNKEKCESDEWKKHEVFKKIATKAANMTMLAANAGHDLDEKKRDKSMELIIKLNEEIEQLYSN